MTQACLQLDAHQLAAQIKREARLLGFDLVGISSAEPSKYREYFRQWLDHGQHGTMHYLAKRFEERTDPASYFPGAQSVICVAMNYHVSLDPAQQDGPRGKIAQYALGDDYHEVIKSKLHRLADLIRQVAPDAQTKCSVDTAPVMEKELAARAGIGWLGKNSCVINERIGSWILLGEILTTLRLLPDEPAIDRCGTCRRCIDACPTGAITEPYKLDARKCISYLTIEHREEIDLNLKSQIGDWLYGCDICQEVCPWNGQAPDSNEVQFRPRFRSGSLAIQDVLEWGASDYSDQLKNSAMKRVKLPILQRNARIVAENISSK